VSDFLDKPDPDRVRVLPRGVREPNSRTVHLGQGGLGMGQALQLAGLTGNRPLPLRTMAEDHGALLKAFRDSEGRDPNPDGDPNFWSAYNTVSKSHTGEEPATVPSEIPNLGHDSATDWERMSKAADTPTWADDFAALHGTTVEEIREAFREN
jgi:hypothetical protein